MVTKPVLFLSLLICLAAGPGLWAGEATEAVVPTASANDEAVAPEPAPASAEPKQLPRSFEEILEESARADMIGCTASYNCVHGTIVSCSAPVNGTCSSSGARCGSVTCDGQTTWCPGSCRTDIHCFFFCSSGGYCDEFGCCECQ